jgi:hypothetical protein
MSLRRQILEQQERWARAHGLAPGPPVGRPGSTVSGYLPVLEQNLFVPLDAESRAQFLAGAGGELASGKLWATHSSAALCVNVFQYWRRFLAMPHGAEREAALAPLLPACGVVPMAIERIDFEVKNVVNPRFRTAPHLDVQMAAGGGVVAIESKFCEPYRGKPVAGLHGAYLRETRLWDGWPSLRALAGAISPEDGQHRHLHAAQLVQHLLGLRRQYGGRFVLVYLWFDVAGDPEAAAHGEEVRRFCAVAAQDGIPFAARGYRELFDSLPATGEHAAYVAYLRQRYG